MRDARLELKKGNYQKIIDQVRLTPRSAAIDPVAVIGAHSFLGHVQEAFQSWRAVQDSLSLEDRVLARFFLGLALTRISNFKRAKALFKMNLQEAVSPAARGYAFQGAGFYSYFQGQFGKALKWSQQALRQAIQSRETYIEFLAMDLLGHATVQTGRRSEGLRLMQEANRLARATGNSNFSAAFSDARLIYEAEVGLRSRTLLAELTAALHDTTLADSYTRSNLVLELARQLTLRGQYEKAKGLLNEQASAIYALGNKRQEVMLQLRLAEISYQQADFHLMNHLMQSAKKTVALLADQAFEIRLLGLAMKIPAEISFGLSTDELRSALESSVQHSSLVNRQILFRQGLAADPQTPIGEDPLHDLFCLAQSDQIRARETCLEQGYFGLYRQLAGLKPGTEFLQIIDGGKAFVAGSREEIRHQKVRLSSQQLKLLRTLTHPSSTKERILETVWGYTYDPLRHDSLIHNAIGKLRRILGPMSSWIVTTEEGWAWDRKVLLLMDLPDQQVMTPAQSMKEIDFNPEDLNFRQLKALKTAPEDSGWSVSTYKKSFKVSTMTAFRDLTHLHAKGLVLRTGRGRACRYLLRRDSES